MFEMKLLVVTLKVAVPVAAPLGMLKVIEVGLHLVMSRLPVAPSGGPQVAPLLSVRVTKSDKGRELEAPKFSPVIVMAVPADPLVGDMPVITGALGGSVTEEVIDTGTAFDKLPPTPTSA